MPDKFVLWAASDAHVGTDIRFGRESLADALRQSEHGGSEGGPAFHWDLMIDTGDMSGSQTLPDDEEGELAVAQYGALEAHDREQIYNVVGNHDATRGERGTQWWFRKWIDPLGENTASSGVRPDRRPYPVTGTWERYKFEAGNLLLLMMADRNDLDPPIGRGDVGGYPAGAVSKETFDWWTEQIEAHPDRIVISAHHHMLKETTVASGDWEGVDNGYHGRFEDGAPIGASYLYFVGGEPDSGRFEGYLADPPGALDLWLGSHTHTHPDDRTGGRSHIERKWDTNFINHAALSRYHGKRNVPMSRVLTFTSGSDEVDIRCYLHTSHYAPQGWYEPAQRTLRLSRPFEPPS